MSNHFACIQSCDACYKWTASWYKYYVLCNDGRPFLYLISNTRKPLSHSDNLRPLFNFLPSFFTGCKQASILAHNMPLWGPSYRDHSSHSYIDRNYMNDGYIERPYRSSSSHGRAFPSPRPSAFLQPTMSCGPIVYGPAGNMYGSGRESWCVLTVPCLSIYAESPNPTPTPVLYTGLTLTRPTPC